jgi:hypothetical protein
VVTMNTMPTDDATGLLLMAKQKYSFINLTTPEGAWARKNYNVAGNPTTILLDADGKTILRHRGYSPEGVRGLDQAIPVLLERAKASKKN